MSDYFMHASNVPRKRMQFVNSYPVCVYTDVDVTLGNTPAHVFDRCYVTIHACTTSHAPQATSLVSRVTGNHVLFDETGDKLPVCVLRAWFIHVVLSSSVLTMYSSECDITATRHPTVAEALGGLVSARSHHNIFARQYTQQRGKEAVFCPQSSRKLTKCV